MHPKMRNLLQLYSFLLSLSLAQCGNITREYSPNISADHLDHLDHFPNFPEKAEIATQQFGNFPVIGGSGVGISPPGLTKY